MRRGNTYVVKTNLPPEMVTQIGAAIFAMWVDFAMGRAELNGRRLVYPTGRYAASISFQKTGESSVAIVADEDVAPEAAVLEYGHGPIDLKTRLRYGRAYPMHRPVGSNQAAPQLRRVGSGPPGMKPRMWAEIRTREASGFASIGPDSPPDSWIIPSMVAYSPAMILAAMLRRSTGGS